MLWKGQRESSNVEDRRGYGPHIAVGGGIATLIVLIAAHFLGINPQDVLNQLPSSSAPAQNSGVPADPHQEELKQFVSVVLADTEDVWGEQFRQMGKQYAAPKLVLYSDQADSACGFASAAVGPFYCPEDEKVYLDLTFLDELGTKYGAAGDFAQAYVISHEIGHHVQRQLGIMQKVDAQREQAGKKELNALSVRLELQADFLAGVWAHYAQQMKGVIEPGDIDEAIRAASAVGDDRLQQQAQGYVVPDSFTHGTAEQRARWFRKGYETGDIKQGDTFSARSL